MKRNVKPLLVFQLDDSTQARIQALPPPQKSEGGATIEIIKITLKVELYRKTKYNFFRGGQGREFTKYTDYFRRKPGGGHNIFRALRLASPGKILYPPLTLRIIVPAPTKKRLFCIKKNNYRRNNADA